MNANLSLRPDLDDRAPYGALEVDVPVRLNVNENPYPPSAAVIESIATAVVQVVQRLNRYPEQDFPRLRAALAGYLETESGVHLAPGQIWAANGSNEVMSHVLRTFGGPGRTCLGFTPTYSMYPECAHDTLTDHATRPCRKGFTLDVDGAANTVKELRSTVIILASPNSPAGTALPLEDIKRIFKAARGHGPMFGAEIGSPTRASDCVVVIDETYAEFHRPGVPSALELMEPDNPHLAITRAMSKTFGTAGLRLGYPAANRALVDALRVVRLPYHLSTVTQAAALAALSHRGEFMAQVASLRDEYDAFVDWLRTQGLSVREPDANFVPFGPSPGREAVWQALLDAGVLIRVVGPEGFLCANIGTPEEIARLRAALTSAIGRWKGCRQRSASGTSRVAID